MMNLLNCINEGKDLVEFIKETKKYRKFLVSSRYVIIKLLIKISPADLADGIDHVYDVCFCINFYLQIIFI